MVRPPPFGGSDTVRIATVPRGHEVTWWMVVHEGTHGNRGQTKCGLTEVEADAILARFALNNPLQSFGDRLA